MKMIKVAVIVDDAPYASSQLTTLLKVVRRPLVVIGAGESKIFPPKFNIWWRKKMSSALLLQTGSPDMMELTSHWKSLRVADDVVVEEICDFLCDHCGGHFYSIAKFMEYAFTNSEATPYLKSLDDFKHHFFSLTFASSSTNEDVNFRCFHRSWIGVMAFSYSDLPTSSR